MPDRFDWLDAARAADLIAGLLLVEAAWLLWRHRRTGRGPRAAEVLAMLGAGFALVMALRGVASGLAWPWTALWLAVAGIAHICDLIQRIGGSRPGA
ncbi:hypothetical protein [Piscinibacter defluvii]|uniref:hypothetical protein n=1 Tax=Piscinibacter defluvii TaxID=1796922 RepID=UPI000FDD9354|nr:hypothetical protein [Piscinibacter defluvii]